MKDESEDQDGFDQGLTESIEAVGSAESLPEEPEVIPVDFLPDARLYVPENQDWQVHLKRDSERIHCYAKYPGQEWFHLIVNGEIFVTRQHEKFCLRCALRMGFLTQDRLFWQHRVPQKPKPIV